MSGEFGAFGEPIEPDADDPIGHKQWLESLDIAYGEEDEDRSYYWQTRLLLRWSY